MARAKITSDRCEHCGARYDDLRTGLGDAGSYASAQIAAAGRDRTTCGSGDGGHVTIASARADLGRVKRGLWASLHGPGRCIGDDSTHSGRVSIAAVVLGWPDTAAIMGAVPEWIDASDRTIWTALPIGSGPNPPSLASLMLEIIDGDAGAVDAFDDLDYRRSESGIPSAY